MKNLAISDSQIRGIRNSYPSALLFLPLIFPFQIPLTHNISDIAKIINASQEMILNDDPIRGLLIDSRNLAQTEGILFFAIKGERHNALEFLGDIYEKGIRNFVVNELPENAEVNFPESNFLVVADTLVAL